MRCNARVAQSMRVTGAIFVELVAIKRIRAIAATAPDLLQVNMRGGSSVVRMKAPR